MLDHLSRTAPRRLQHVLALGAVLLALTTATAQAETPAERTARKAAIANLTKRAWTLSSYSKAPDNNLPFGKGTRLTFKPDGTFSGRLCNQLSGAFALGPDDTITFSQLTRTKMLCPQPLMGAEDFVRNGTYSYDITKGYLTLQRDGNSISLRRATTSRENPMAN